MTSETSQLSRRQVLTILAGLGVGTDVFRRALAAQVEARQGVTPEMVHYASWIADIELDPDDEAAVSAAVSRAQRDVRRMREIDIGYDVPPALYFNAAPAERFCDAPSPSVRPIDHTAPSMPDDPADLAFLPVVELSALLKRREVSSVELTKVYLDRLKKYGPVLECVVTLTEKVAMEQARRADREIAAGRWRGPLHGVPWGAKDLIAWPGYTTTWGCERFKDQTIDTKATVARRLEEAGAVLLAKLSLGTLAWGDRWHGGLTRNPWNIDQGASGSSAGSASATVAGLVGFSLGSETLGSIISPCKRCGATGLRPTFGRVSRHGCMTLAWSMDKIGPIARSVEDCALVFGAICGYDGLDPTAVDRPFHWPMKKDVSNLRVGYLEEGDADRRELLILREVGVELVPMKLPDNPPAWPLTMILGTEAAAAFDPVVQSGDFSELGKWKETFVSRQFTLAVDYLRANRIRTLLMREMNDLFNRHRIDMYVGGDDLAITNLTGHPSLALPVEMVKQGEVDSPSVTTITGKLFGETELLAMGWAFEQAAGANLSRPPLDRWLQQPGDE